MPSVHPTSVVEPGAELAAGVVIGPFCVVGSRVVLAEGVRLHSHVVVGGTTEIGANTEVFPFASLGLAPQDLKYRGEASRLRIGRDCRIREHVTLNPGTVGGGLLTQIGDGCLLMVGAHVAHDCSLADYVILVNNVLLAGHVSIGEHAIVGGGAAVHQHVRIGRHAFVGGLSGVENDIIPFGSAIGNRAYLGGLNLVGLKRHGFTRDAIHALRNAYRLLFSEQGTLRQRVESVSLAFPQDENVQAIVAFLLEGGERAVCTPRSAREVERTS